MKKRILSLVLCAALLLSLCLFMGAGVAADAPATEDFVPAVNFTNAGPLLKPAQTAGPARVRAIAADNTGSGVQLSKTVTKDENSDAYTVRLEAYATGAQTTVVSTKPCDIVLVLDVSGSMDWCIEGGRYCSGNHYTATYSVDPNKYDYSNGITYYIKDASGNYQPLTWCDGQHRGWFGSSENCAGGEGWYPSRDQDQHTAANKLTPKTSADSAGTQFYEKVGCTSRLSALKTAVGNFIDQVADKETDTVKHNISIVKFSGDKTNKIGNNTYTSGGYTYNYSQIVKDLTDVKTGQQELKDAVNALNAAGATRSDNGMEHAKDILSTVSRDSTKVVVMFTDGSPTERSDFSEDVADGAISAAKSLKDSGATVYTVGCLDGADGTPVTDINSNSVSDVNKYMHLVSSNYKNAESMSSPGTSTYPAGGKSYYLSAGNSTELNNVFENISSQIGGSDAELTSSSVLKDAVTPYFEIPGGTNAPITLKTADCTGAANGKLTFGAETAAPGNVTATVSGNTVSVTGFDYKDNWCGSHSGTYSGKKLIVEFKIQPTDAFLGGNGVQTNVGTDDGIYASSEAGKEPVERFAPQNVDVPVKAVVPQATDTAIYLGETTNLADRVTTDVSQLDGENNRYVAVTYTVKDENGGTVGTYTVPAGSSSGTWAWNDAASGGTVAPKQTTTYTVTCTVSPTQTGTYESVSKDAAFTITVKTCSLKISKAVTGDGANPNQTFVFDVKDSTGKLVTTIVLKDGEQKTITGLAVGTYTVTEDTNWSWSYSIVGDNNRQAALSSTMPSTTVDVTNHYNSHNWLTSIADVINTWISGNAAQKN